MATSTWTSAVSADWDTGADWSNSAPTAQSTVAVAAPGSYDITIGATESVSIDSISLSTAELSVLGPLTLDDAQATSVIGPQGTLQFGAQVGDNYTIYDDGGLSNAGTILQSGSSYFAPIWANSFDNTGLMIAEAGSQISVGSETLTNLQHGVLSGGTYDAIGENSQIDLQSPVATPATIAVDNANITLSGYGSDIDGYTYNASSGAYTSVPLEASLATIAPNGVLNLLGDFDYDGTLTLTDNGLINLGGGSLAAAGLTLGSNGTLAGFGTVVPNVAGAGLIVAQGGTLALAGGLSGTTSVQVAQGAALESAGSLDLAGNVTGSGDVVIAGGAVGSTTTLELSSAVSNTVSFGGDFATLQLDQPRNFTGTIAALGAGDTIDLRGVVATGATLVGNVLDVMDNASTVDALSMANLASGQSFTTLSDGAGGTDLVAAGSGLKFNFIYDPAVANAPAAFEQDMTIAGDVLGAIITNPITLNIEVGWGEIDGDATGFTGDDADGLGGPDNTITLPYSVFKADYLAAASNPEQVEAAENLPVADPTNGAGVELSAAEQQAWGLLPANTTLQAGSVGFSDDTNWDYSTTWDPSYDDSLIDVALHEITHAMGRIDNYLGLFRYTAPGVAQPNDTGPGYFSIDNGTTDLANFDTTGSDAFDWADSFEDSLSAGGEEPGTPSFSSPDNAVMSALGFDDVANFEGGITGASAGQTVAAGDTITPFASMVVSDPILYDQDTLTITIADANGVTDDLGTLSYDGNDGLSLTQTGAGTYSLSAGTAGSVTTALNHLVFTADAGAISNETATLTVTDSNINAPTSSAVTDVTITPATGLSSINAGSAATAQVIPSGSNYVTTEGANTITASGGSTTVNASTGSPVIFGGASSLDFIGGAGAATVVGGTSNTVTGGSGNLLLFAVSTTNFNAGTGAATIIGGQGGVTASLGAGGGEAFGGSGTNTLTDAGASGSTTTALVAAGAGDLISVSGGGTNIMVAAAGAETLAGAQSSGLDVLYGGSGADSMVGGTGDNFFLAGTGNDTLVANGTFSQIDVVAGTGPRSITIENFTSDSYLALFGYGADPVGVAQAAAVSSGGSTTLSLSDGTTLILAGVTQLNPSNII